MIKQALVSRYIERDDLAKLLQRLFSSNFKIEVCLHAGLITLRMLISIG